MHFALNQQSSELSPAVVAALIAVPVGLLTVLVQWLGVRRVSKDTNTQLERRGEQLDRTLAEQREQLDRTLAEQREQLNRTLAEERDRTLNERFATAADRLGADKPAAVRLAAVYAMAGLADDWVKNRQTCVEVLCAYLRLPYAPDPGDDGPAPERLEFRSNQEVRHAAIRVIRDHLRPSAATPWRGLHFDFKDAQFDGGDFSYADFSAGEVDFTGARFSGHVYFFGATFSGAVVYFMNTEFSGWFAFSGAKFSGSEVHFLDARFSGGEVSFTDAEFSGGRVDFSAAKFSGSNVYFGAAKFSGGRVDFSAAEFSGSNVYFMDAEFSGGRVDFSAAEFSGGQVYFLGAEFSGGQVDFGGVRTWSKPAIFDFEGASPPPGVILPPDHLSVPDQQQLRWRMVPGVSSWYLHHRGGMRGHRPEPDR